MHCGRSAVCMLESNTVADTAARCAALYAEICSKLKFGLTVRALDKAVNKGESNAVEGLAPVKCMKGTIVSFAGPRPTGQNPRNQFNINACRVYRGQTGYGMMIYTLQA